MIMKLSAISTTSPWWKKAPTTMIPLTHFLDTIVPRPQEICPRKHHRQICPRQREKSGKKQLQRRLPLSRHVHFTRVCPLSQLYRARTEQQQQSRSVRTLHQRVLESLAIQRKYELFTRNVLLSLSSLWSNLLHLPLCGKREFFVSRQHQHSHQNLCYFLFFHALCPVSQYVVRYVYDPFQLQWQPFTQTRRVHIVQLCHQPCSALYHSTFHVRSLLGKFPHHRSHFELPHRHLFD